MDIYIYIYIHTYIHTYIYVYISRTTPFTHQVHERFSLSRTWCVKAVGIHAPGASIPRPLPLPPLLPPALHCAHRAPPPSLRSPHCSELMAASCQPAYHPQPHRPVARGGGNGDDDNDDAAAADEAGGVDTDRRGGPLLSAARPPPHGVLHCPASACSRSVPARPRAETQRSHHWWRDHWCGHATPLAVNDVIIGAAPVALAPGSRT